ncbi:MAG: helix-turn-helix domain-containing protein [Candidatus Pacebacteria bacterium]|nr:helix-turn-helix domain-containing protein [Candidatus Paceibacterota bacterium]
MDIPEALAVLGLNDKQIAVYTALLQLGKGSAYSIADKAGIKRPTTYVILGELIDKGLAERVPRARKQSYRPISPEQAFGVAEEKLSLAKEKLPELLAMSKGADTKVNVLYFEGLKGIKQVMEYKRDEDKGKEILGFYATSKDLPKELTDYFDEWNSKLGKRRITMRGIVPDHESLAYHRELDAKLGRDMKVIPHNEFSSEVAIDISERIVRIHDYKNLQGIAIENADIARTMREIFEMVWKRTS